MGGYVISRNSEGSEVSPYLSPLRCTLESQLDTQLEIKEVRGGRYTTIDGRGKCIGESTSMEGENDEALHYKLLFPHSLHSPFHLATENGSKASTNICHPFSSDPNLSSRHQPLNSRLIVAGRGDRVNKSRKISPSTTRDPKTPVSPQRSELPKTPMSWSSEDDILLRDLKELRKLGWKEISAYFPKRTAHACQFRWRRLVSGTLKGHRQCPPQISGTQPVPAAGGRGLSDDTSFLRNFEVQAQNPRSSSIFDITSPQTETNTLGTSLSSPSSPSSFVDSKALRSPVMISRSGSMSPPTRRPRYGIISNERETSHSTWETSDDDHHHPRKFAEAKKMGKLFDEDVKARTSPDAQGHLRRLLDSNTAPQYGEDGYRIPENTSWTSEEDSLLLNRRLSFDEVSILLHHRSEEAIWSRMGILRSSIPKSVRLGCPPLMT